MFRYLVHRLVHSLQSQPLHIIQVADMYKAIESVVDRDERSAVKDAFNGQLYTVQVSDAESE